MATIAADYTLLELAKRLDPDGTQATIAEIMAKEIPMILDIPFYPSNDVWSHKSVRRANIPSGNWRGLNQYVAGEKSQVDEIMDVIGINETFATYDKEYIDNQPDPKMARMNEATAFIEGLAQELCSAFLYGNNKVTPEKPHGIAPRLSSTGRYVISNGGSGNDVTSIYVMGWGINSCFAVYPKNSNAPGGEFPIIHTDLGIRVDMDVTNSTDANKNRKLVVYEDNFKMKAGLVIKDPRYVGRLANIETSGSSNIFDEDNLITLLGRMKITANTVMYCNETILTQMRIAMKDKNNVNFTPGKGAGLFGEPVIFFDGIPIRKIDSAILLDTESAI